MSQEMSEKTLQSLCGVSVLVTGGCGLVGSRIVNQLTHIGAKVTALDNLSAYPFDYAARNGIRDLDVLLVKGDISDASLVSKVVGQNEIVIHAAAFADVAGCTDNHQENFMTNVRGTYTMLNACLRKKINRFVFISSASVYGNQGNGARRFKEELTGTPVSNYANSKLWGEQETRLFHEMYGLPTVTLRYFSVYGPPQLTKRGSHSWCIAIFTMQALKGKPITVFGDGSQIRDFIYVDDVAHGTILSLISDDAVGESINIGTGQKTEILEVARIIQELTGTTSIEFRPRVKGDPKGGYADTGKMKTILNWSPETSFEVGVHRYVNWLDGNRDLIPKWL